MPNYRPVSSRIDNELAYTRHYAKVRRVVGRMQNVERARATWTLASAHAMPNGRPSPAMLLQ